MEEILSRCLESLEKKDRTTFFNLLPRISVSKNKCLLPILKKALSSHNRQQEEMAVCALAALADEEALSILFDKFNDDRLFLGPGSHKLQTMLLDAIGEIGSDRATEELHRLFDLNLPRDNFRRKRQVVILDVLGSIAQQGGTEALAKLVSFVDHKDFIIRAGAVTNICTAFWHRPNEIPPEIFNKLLTLFRDSNLYVQYALISALENLADIGCEMALELFAG